MRIFISHPLVNLVNRYLVESPLYWNIGSYLKFCYATQVISSILLGYIFLSCGLSCVFSGQYDILIADTWYYSSLTLLNSIFMISTLVALYIHKNHYYDSRGLYSKWASQTADYKRHYAYLCLVTVLLSIIYVIVALFMFLTIYSYFFNTVQLCDAIKLTGQEVVALDIHNNRNLTFSVNQVNSFISSMRGAVTAINASNFEGTITFRGIFDTFPLRFGTTDLAIMRGLTEATHTDLNFAHRNGFDMHSIAMSKYGGTTYKAGVLEYIIAS